MKSISIQAIFLFLIMGTALSQVETFEDETPDSTFFNIGGVNFTLTGDLLIEEVLHNGCGGTGDHRFIGSGTLDGGSSGLVGSIMVTNPEDKFMVSTVTPWCAFLSDTDGRTYISGDIKFQGILSNGDTLEESFNVVRDPNNNGWDIITFSSEIWGNKELIALEVIIFSDINYMSLDNIAFNNTVTTSLPYIPTEEIKIYPNPTSGQIGITGIDDVEVQVIDAFGRQVRKQSLFNQRMDISGLVPGIYYVSFESHDHKITKRVVKL